MLSTRPLSGGSINQACRIETNLGVFFVKWNDAKACPGMFKAESRGLEILARTGAIRIPEVIHCGEDLLILEYLEQDRPAPNFWETFGQQLARLHQHTHPTFGLDHDNYIGSLPQSNTPHNTWADFFREARLQPQIRMARDSKQLDQPTCSLLNGVMDRLPQLFPDEPPALLHGDLWSGNYLIGPEGQPCLIDPAVYHGHREMDLAMTRLFGGFDAAFYASYNEAHPLEPDWESRTDLCNLYPLLVHVNLFGSGYASQVRHIAGHYS